MSLFLTLSAIAGLAAGARAEKCTPLGEAATAAGLTSLADAIGAVSTLPPDGWYTGKDLNRLLNLTEDLDEDGKLTLFAPTNAAFDAISDVVATLTPDQILDVLINHIGTSDLPSGAILAAIEDFAPNPARIGTLAANTLEATLEGSDIFISPIRTDIKAKVVTADVKTCVGTVHVIDAVLVPGPPAPHPEYLPSAPGPDCVSMVDAATAAGLTTLVDTVTAVAEVEGSEGLLAAVTATAGFESLVTVFAPTNDAFAAISDVVGGLSNEQILDVLLNHVEGVRTDSAELRGLVDLDAPKPAAIYTLAGGIIEVTLDGEDLILTPVGQPSIKAKVVTADVLTCGGVVHVIDAVLVPGDRTEQDASMGAASSGLEGREPPMMIPGGAPTPVPPEGGTPTPAPAGGAPTPVPAGGTPTSAPAGGTPTPAPADGDAEESMAEFNATPVAVCVTVAEAATAANLTSLLDAVGAVSEVEAASGLLAALTANTSLDTKLTVFAPTNEAFDAISEVVATLSADDVLNVLLNHVVEGELDVAAVLDAIASAEPSPATVTTLLSSTLDVSQEGSDVIITPTGTEITSKVVVTDVMTCAGVVHVVDMVLVPAADTATTESTTPDGASTDTTTADRGTDAAATVIEPVSAAFSAPVLSAVVAMAAAAMMMV